MHWNALLHSPGRGHPQDLPTHQGGMTSRLLTLAQDPDCPTFTEDFLGNISYTTALADGVQANWLQTNSSGASFVDEMIDLYVNDKLIGVKGEDILEDGGVCKYLPLKKEECYFVINPEQSFLETLVANYIPFGKDILNVMDKIEEIQGEITDEIDDVKALFVPEAEPTGTCYVTNREMFGIVDVPGKQSLADRKNTVRNNIHFH